MQFQKIFLFIFFSYLVFLSNQAKALTVQQFKDACSAHEQACETHPFLNAYIGGALDLIAGLQEETEYLSTLYCGDQKQIFDIEKITKFIENADVEYDQTNAMLLVVAYFEENGGC